MKITILGSGSSSGVPGVGIGWGACNPDNPKNRRLRPSILIGVAGKTILVDTSPDLREQLLRTQTTHLDGVLFTHAHADHLNGLDDLRGINRAMNAPLDVFGDGPTLQTIRDRFSYVLSPLADDATVYYKPVLHPSEVSPGMQFEIGGVKILAFDQDHGKSRTLGYRIGSFAYSTDVVEMPEPSFDVLAGVHTWVLGCFTNQPHLTHVHVEKALEWIARVKPVRAVLTHLGPALDYDELTHMVPDGVDVAFDGYSIDVPE